jgi:signal transduction histidine kinase
LPHVFERFHRGSNVERISGTGLGLAGAKDIIEQHGGSISMTSAEGQGTTVMVRLPLAGGVAE